MPQVIVVNKRDMIHGVAAVAFIVGGRAVWLFGWRRYSISTRTVN